MPSYTLNPFSGELIPTAAASVATPASASRFISLHQPGDLQITTGTARWYPPGDVTLQSISVFVGTAPFGGDVQFVLLKNGVAIGSGTIAEDQYLSPVLELDVALTSSDYLTLDITAIGATIPGSDLHLRITLG
uniref:Uncharacterized protein n=1 Tax=Magnetococcus massalia (strain MO-1) TaxID=451514 RepID=A0A1S7LLB6_MAGMO|nr:Protein of unknown function [Candidatus Magnetococcus massalia]